jgi:hypothetical protein
MDDYHSEYITKSTIKALVKFYCFMQRTLIRELNKGKLKERKRVGMCYIQFWATLVWRVRNT